MWLTSHGSGRQSANAALSCVRCQLHQPCCKPVISGTTIWNILTLMTTTSTTPMTMTQPQQSGNDNQEDNAHNDSSGDNCGNDDSCSYDPRLRDTTTMMDNDGNGGNSRHPTL